MGIPNILGFLHNETQYRTKRIADFWEPKIKPVVNALNGKKDSPLNGIVDHNERPKINGVTPQLPSEMLEEGVANLAAPLLNVASNGLQALGVDSRVANVGIPLLGLTVSNPKFLANGVKNGIATGADFGPAMRKWNARRNELIEQRRYPAGLNANRRLKNQKKSLVTAYNDVSTGPTRDPLDVEAYDRGKFKVKGKEQHHLFPKQESYQFVEQMKKIGDDDDVLNLFLYAEEIDATMGGRLSNMLNMDKKPHNGLHANRIKDGRQLNSIKMKNLVQSAKSTDELMELFDRYIVENIQPSKGEAKALQKVFDKSKANLNKFKTLSEADRRRL
tara:strand:- start:80 stop:1075 length:996 start_codon:yes stop_codon:yes gene_type:complete